LWTCNRQYRFNLTHRLLAVIVPGPVIHQACQPNSWVYLDGGFICGSYQHNAGFDWQKHRPGLCYGLRPVACCAALHKWSGNQHLDRKGIRHRGDQGKAEKYRLAGDAVKQPGLLLTMLLLSRAIFAVEPARLQIHIGASRRQPRPILVGERWPIVVDATAIAWAPLPVPKRTCGVQNQTQSSIAEAPSCLERRRNCRHHPCGRSL
jgi:hypothetical protein